MFTFSSLSVCRCVCPCVSSEVLGLGVFTAELVIIRMEGLLTNVLLKHFTLNILDVAVSRFTKTRAKTPNLGCYDHPFFF